MSATNTNQTLSDVAIDALLDADDATNEGNALAIFCRIHERRRKRAHAAAKAVQPELGVRGRTMEPALLVKIEQFWRKPLTPEDFESNTGAMDYLLQTIQDTIAAGDVEDAVFAMARVARKAWAWNQAHLGPIEGR